MKKMINRMNLKTMLASVALMFTCMSVATAGQWDPPQVEQSFSGTATGTVKWVHNTNNWFVFVVEQLHPSQGQASMFQSWIDQKQGIKVGLKWVGPKTPDPKAVDFFKSLKPGQRLTLQLESISQNKAVRMVAVPGTEEEKAGIATATVAAVAKAGAPKSESAPRTPEYWNITQALRTTGPALTHTLPSGESFRYARLKTGQMEYVMGVIYHPKDPDLSYLRLDMNGAYRRDKSSPSSWLWLMDSLTPADGDRMKLFNEPTGMAVDPNDAEVVYYAAHDSGKGGLFRSADRGDTWTKIFPREGSIFVENRGRDKLRGESVAVDPFDGKTIYFGTQLDGLFVTNDGGDTWRQAMPGTGKDGSEMLTVTVAKLDQVSGRSQYVYAVRWGEGVFESRDGGATFALIPDSPKQGKSLSVSGSGYLFATSRDGGVWRYRIETRQNDGVVAADAGRNVAASPGKDGAVIAIGHDFVMRSRDHGTTWEKLSVKDGNLEVVRIPVHGWDRFSHLNALSLHSDGKRVLIGAPFKVFESMDIWAEKPQFVAIVEGADSKAINGMACPPAVPSGRVAPLYWTCADHTLYRMENPETPVVNTLIYRSFPNSVDYSEENPEILWVTKFSGGSGQGMGVTAIRRTTDGGSLTTPGGSFKRLTDPFPAEKGKAEGVRIAVRAKGAGDHALVVGWTPRPTRMRYTLDGGKTWQSPKNEPDARSGPSIWPGNNAVAADRVNGDYYIYGAFTGRFHRSQDGGATWEKMSENLPKNPAVWVPHATWYDVQSVPGKAGHVVLGLRNEVRTTSDGGASWRVVEGFESIRNGCPGPGLQEGKDPVLYVYGKRPGDFWGIYRSRDWFTAATPAWERITPDVDVGGVEGGRRMIADRQVLGRVYMDNAESVYVEPIR